MSQFEAPIALTPSLPSSRNEALERCLVGADIALLRDRVLQAHQWRDVQLRAASGPGSISAARLPTSCCSAMTAAAIPRRCRRRSTIMPARSSTGWRRCSAEIGAEASRHRRIAARHDGRVERDPRAQGRQDRADHHQGVPRRPGNPQSADAAALRHVVDQAAAAGRAAPAGRGRRAGQCPGRRRPAARRGERRARRAVPGRGGGRGDRGLPAALLPQPGARGAGQGDRRAPRARRDPVHQRRGVAGHQRIRAHARRRSSTPMSGRSSSAT